MISKNTACCHYSTLSSVVFCMSAVIVAASGMKYEPRNRNDPHRPHSSRPSATTGRDWRSKRLHSQGDLEETVLLQYVWCWQLSDSREWSSCSISTMRRSSKYKPQTTPKTTADKVIISMACMLQCFYSAILMDSY